MSKILMIDDNPIEHLIMQRLFNKLKIFPDAEYSLEAKSIMEYLEQNYSATDDIPDVIFLDLNMPVFNGWDFLDCFENLYKKIKKPVDIYIISSSIDPQDKLLSEKYYFVKGTMCKPVKPETLLNLYSLYQLKRLAS